MLFILTSFSIPFTKGTKSFIGEGFVPFFDFSTRFQGSIALLAQRFKGYRDLQVENSELRKQLSELSTRVAQIGELERENREFRSMLDFKNRSELKLLSAKVIGRDPSNWWNAIIVDRGSVDGITRDMPVLSVEGLVGKTIEVTENKALVILIIDENCKVSGWMPDSGQYGIVQGNILTGGSGFQCRMTFVDRFAQVKDQDRVYTSGLGGIFPKNQLIGTVRLIKTNQDSLQNNLYQEVRVTPAVDLSRIDEVFIGIGVKPPEKEKSKKYSRSKNERK